MKIRSIIMLLTIPLFLFVAAINGAVLYFQEEAEMSRALNDQTLAAAVVTAEFVAEMDDPIQELMKPHRRSGIDAATAQIEGLQGLYLIASSGANVPLMTNSAAWEPPVRWVGRAAQHEVNEHNSDDEHFVAAIVPAGNGYAVAARVDADPMLANRTKITNFILLIILCVSVFSAGLSWFVARRVVHELRLNGQAFSEAAEASEAGNGIDLKIRETRDLSDAVRLMKASQTAAETRHKRHVDRSNRERTADSAAESLHAALFAPQIVESGAAQIAVRICGKPSAGRFFAVAFSEGETSVVVGLCNTDEPGNGLTNALAARRFIEGNLAAMGTEQCLNVAKRAFQIERLEKLSWQADALPQGEQAIAGIASDKAIADARKIFAQNRGLAPAAALTAIEVLLDGSGIFVAVGLSRPSKDSISL